MARGPPDSPSAKPWQLHLPRNFPRESNFLMLFFKKFDNEDVSRRIYCYQRRAEAPAVRLLSPRIDKGVRLAQASLKEAKTNLEDPE